MQTYSNKMMRSEGGIILIGNSEEEERKRRESLLREGRVYETKVDMPKKSKKPEPLKKGYFRMMSKQGEKVYYQDLPPDSTIKDSRGRLYRVMEDGSLRRIREK